jgi:hypothetical protein
VTALDRGCAKTPAFDLHVESSSRFLQTENQIFWRGVSEDGNRENDSTVSLLAHVFTRPGPIRDTSRRGGPPGAAMSVDPSPWP